jgi:transposase-like protein
MERGRGDHYDPEVKLRAVEMFLEEGCSASSIVVELGLSSTYTLAGWVDRYRRLGADGLVRTKTHVRYEQETKLAAAQMHVDGGKTLAETMEHFEIRNRTQIKNWCALYREGGPDALAPKPKGRRRKPEQTAPAEEDLVERCRRLEVENAYLKKSIALAEERTRARRR